MQTQTQLKAVCDTRDESPLTAFAGHPLAEAVREDLCSLVDISDRDLAWVVEATLFQLQRMARRDGLVDLEYLGSMEHCREGFSVTHPGELTWRPEPRAEDA